MGRQGAHHLFHLRVPGGRLVYRSNTESINGSWTQTGNNVTVRVGRSFEQGQITGNKLVLLCDTTGVGAGVGTVTVDD